MPKKDSEISAPAQPAQIIDVAKPSDTPASATSRPIIVGHMNSMQKDPMVAGASQPSDSDAVSAAAKSLYDKPKTEKTVVPVNDIKPETPAAEPSITDTSVSEPAKNSETAIVDALVSELDTKKDRVQKDVQEQKLSEEIEQLVNSKQYYVKTHTPANKRNLRWLFVIVLLLFLLGAGWYFMMGPGKDLWAKSDQVAPVAATVPAVTADTTKKESVPVIDTKKIFSDPSLKLSFSYPKTWTAEVSKDKEFPTRDVITLFSAVENVNTATKGAPVASAEVSLRTRIILENTTSKTEYASDLIKLSACTSEDIIAASTNLKLLFLDHGVQGPNISQVSLSPENCITKGTLVTGNDQVQFSTKKNTYIVYAEYILSDAYLKKNGQTTKEAIALGQEAGITATVADFKAGKAVVELTDLIKSFKEL